jgi:exosome complex RNA-binding protein Rrp42 (RNase PH superfamily)
MCYVVWRDVDIVRLQKNLIDDAAIAELSAIDLAEAERRSKSMQTASIRSERIPDPQQMSDESQPL